MLLMCVLEVNSRRSLPFRHAQAASAPKKAPTPTPTRRRAELGASYPKGFKLVRSPAPFTQVGMHQSYESVESVFRTCLQYVYLSCTMLYATGQKASEQRDTKNTIEYLSLAARGVAPNPQRPACLKNEAIHQNGRDDQQQIRKPHVSRVNPRRCDALRREYLPHVCASEYLPQSTLTLLRPWNDANPNRIPEPFTTLTSHRPSNKKEQFS